MLQIIEQNDVHTWLGDTTSLMDAAAVLSATLAPDWDVEHAVDPAGETSIVVFSASDDAAMPTFTLFERDWKAVVATVRNDVSESEQNFTGCESAASAIVVEATKAEMLGTGSDGNRFERYE